MSTTSTTSLPTSSNNSKFNLPPEWINKEMQIARSVEHLQAAIVDVSRNLMQIITWSERIQEDIDGMQTSLSISNLETEETNPKGDILVSKHAD